MLPVLLAAAVAAPMADTTAGMKAGTPTFKSISALGFGPGGTLLIGDSTAGTVTAVATDDTTPAKGGEIALAKIDAKLADLLGVKADQIAITDVKVNPASGNAFVSATRGKGPSASPVVFKVTRDGQVAEFGLKDVKFSQITLPNATEKNRAEAITAIGFAGGKVIVAGLSNEEFASTLRAIPYPFEKGGETSGIKIFHGAHGKFETQAPVRTFTSTEINGEPYILAAYTCTPLVKIPLKDLKPGAKVDGVTIAELGNRNRPIDMVPYTKDGKAFLLMANSARGVMKITADGFAAAEAITARPKGETAGVPYETVKELKGVQQMDKLDDTHAVILVKADDGSLNLSTIVLP